MIKKNEMQGAKPFKSIMKPDMTDDDVQVDDNLSLGEYHNYKRV